MSEEVEIYAQDIIIKGNLTIPPKAGGIVIFAHGSGSDRFSPRNNFVASVLNENSFATLLVDLLTEYEEEIDRRTREYRFNIDFLSSRLLFATHYCELDPALKNYNIGYFGASTGAACAIVTAAQHPKPVKAIVSRGGRPDLAGEALSRVTAPTLLLVGSEDHEVIELNRKAYEQLLLVENKELVIIPNATHLFEEPGTLEEVAHKSSEWFGRYLR